MKFTHAGEALGWQRVLHCCFLKYLEMHVLTHWPTGVLRQHDTAELVVIFQEYTIYNVPVEEEQEVTMTARARQTHEQIITKVFGCEHNLGNVSARSSATHFFSIVW